MPWEVSESERPGLLQRFLDADLTDPANREWLIDLTGRRYAIPSTASRREAREIIALGVPKEDVIYPGREQGQWIVPKTVSAGDFLRIYGDLQRYLREARALWIGALNTADRGQRQLLAYNALNRFRQERADATYDVERDPDTGAVVWPKRRETPTPVRRSTSLAGELALALYDELLGAKSTGLCAQCRQPWLAPRKAPGGRAPKRRKLCDRPACAAAWRNEHRKPEDPATVNRRVREWRAANPGWRKRGGKQ